MQPFSQPSTLDGIVVTVGGRGDDPTVHLEDETKTYVCHATRALIRRIAPHIYGKPVRVTGIGHWERSQDGEWQLTRFTIQDFIELKDTPLNTLAESIRDAGWSHWGKSADPLGDLQKLRYGN